MIRKLYLKYLAYKNPVKYAKIVGVNIGERNRLIPPFHFGSEPYLLTVGDDCLISSNVYFFTHDGALHVLRKDIPDAFIYRPIFIGNNVFIGSGVIILCGVSIGDNVIVGAGSVVTHDLPANSVYAGVPAKFIRSIEEYKEKVLPNIDHVNGLCKKERECFLKKKYSIKS